MLHFCAVFDCLNHSDPGGQLQDWFWVILPPNAQVQFGVTVALGLFLVCLNALILDRWDPEICDFTSSFHSFLVLLL